MPEKTMTVGELRQWIADHLSVYSDDTEVVLGQGDLSLSRTKTRRSGSDGQPALVQIEFKQEYEVIQDFD